MTMLPVALVALLAFAQPAYEGRPLADVLRELQAQGVPVAFSSELVTPAMRVARRPRATDPRRLLDEILKPHRLRIEAGPGGMLLVVRVSSRASAAPAASRRSRVEPVGNGIASSAAGLFSERVLVTAPAGASFNASTRGVSPLASEQVTALGAGADDDPMHAATRLPWVATADDSRVDLSARGSAPRQSATVIDGIPAKWLQHTAYGAGDAGSLGMVSALVLDRLSLLSGVYARPAGDWLGPQLDMSLREGSRAARRVQTVLSGMSATLAAEGPVGRSSRGSWIASVRQSYQEWPTRVRDERSGTPFGFADAQFKLVYDVTDRQQATVTLLAGRSRIDERGNGEPNDLGEASNGAAVLSLAWRSTITPSLVARQRVSVLTHRFADVTQAGGDAGHGLDRVLRYDGSLVTRAIGAVAELGVEADAAVSSRVWLNAPAHAQGVTRAAFVQAKWAHGGVTIAPGARLSASTLSDAPAVSRWVTAAWSPAARWTLHGSAGVFEAGPSVDEVSDAIAAEPIGPEHAALFDAFVERALPGGLQWEAGVFARTEHNLFREGPHATVLENGVSGTSRGVELLLRSNTDRTLSGWIAYAYGRTRHIDVPTGESYWAPFDQRHGVSATAFYRASARVSLTATFKAGSNFPVPGAVQFDAGRLDPYARLDLRATRSFETGGRRVMIFAQVLNALNRRNVGIGARGPLVLLPRTPSVGVRIQF